MLRKGRFPTKCWRTLPSRAGIAGAVFLGLLAILILAGPQAAVAPAVAAEIGAQAQVRNCTCRFFGVDYKLGETVCLKGPDGPRLARCSMSLNNTTWERLEKSCPTSSLTPRRLPGQAGNMTLPALLPNAC
jgi:uncharacterized membrane protein